MKSFARIVAIAVFLLSHLYAEAEEPGLVVVDPSDKYATTYVALPKSMPQAQLEQLKSKMSERVGSYIEEWPSFVKDQEKHVTAKILKNEYPELKSAEGLVALLQKFPGTPFGLTWSGGLAVTLNDYMYAKRTYQRYLSDTTFVARPQDRRRDPIYPGNHTEPLLGR